MDNKDYGNQPGGQPHSQASPQPPLKTTISQAEIPKDPQDKPEADQTTAREMRREFRWFEVISLIVNGSLAVIAVIALCIYNGQLKVMQGQLYQMKGGSAQTDRMIEKADSISKSIGTMVTDNKTALEENRKAIQNTLKENRMALESSISQSKAALDASIKASQLDERAWVGMAESAIQFGESYSLSLDVFFANTGKTPATEVDSSVQFVVFPANRPAVPPENATYSFSPQGPFAPQLRHSYNITAQLPRDAYEDVLTGKRHLVFFGKIRYRDAFSTSPTHHTDWCVTYTPTTRTTRSCVKGNAMD